MELPLNVCWGPPHAFDLSNESDLVEAYQATLREGRVVDQARLLNRDLLVTLWPELLLPVRVRALGESRFLTSWSAALRGQGRATTTDKRQRT